MDRYFKAFVSYVAAAAVAGFLFAIIEYFGYYLLQPGPAIGWAFYFSSGFQSWGVMWPWQLLAHKAVSYGWAVPVLAALAAVICWPFRSLIRTLGLRWGTAAIGLASGLVILIHGAFIIRFLSAQEAPASPFKVITPFAAAGLVAAVCLFLGIRALSRVVKSRAFVGSVAALFIFAAAVSYWPFHRRAAVARGPNVIIITIDALRADKVGPNAAGISLTPNIDRWAVGATRFDRCVAPSIWTLTSLASLHAGVYPAVHDARRRQPLGLKFETLAERFRDGGYDTACITSNMLCEPRFGLTQGFDYCRTIEMADGTVGSRLYYTVLPGPFLGGERAMVGTTPVVKRRALRYIKSRKTAKRPFFLWAHFLDPHDPYDPPSAYVSAGVDAARRPVDPGEADGLDDASRVELEALYDGEVRYVDAAVGELLAALRQKGLEDRTIVVITSDHGEEFWEHRRQGHGHQFYDETLRVPLIVKAPGFWAAGRAEGQAKLVDIYATLLSFGGAPARSRNQSRVVYPSKEISTPDKIAFSSNPFDGDLSRVAITDGEKKYIISLETGAYEGFNLKTDPRELSGDRESPIDPLFRDRLRRWRTENRDLISYYGVNSKATPFMDTQLKALGYIK